MLPRSTATEHRWSTATGNRCSIGGPGGGAVNASKQRTSDPLAVDPAQLEARSTASERALWSTMHLQKTPPNRPRTTSDFGR